MVDQVDRPVDDLPQVVRGDVGGHADGDTLGAVHQKVGEAGGQDGGLEQGFVEVGHEIDGVLVDVLHHVGADLAHAGFGVTHGGRAVAVDGAEVALALHQRISDGEILRQADHGVVHGGVPVGVELTQHVAHDTGGLAEGLVRRHAQLVHVVQDAPVHGL